MTHFQKLVEESRNSKLQTSETQAKLLQSNKEAARKLLVAMMTAGMVETMETTKKESNE